MSYTGDIEAPAGTFEWVVAVLAEAYDIGIGRALGGDYVQFRSTITGQFTFADNIWSYFREHYDELVAMGVITE